MTNDDDDQDPFEKALGLPQLPAVVEQQLPELIPDQNVDIKTFVQNDYEFARKQMRDLIVAGGQVFQECADVARQSQDPDSYVSAAEIMKNLIIANEKLVKLSESHAKVTDNKKQQIKAEKDETEAKETGTVTNNTLVVTTTELQAMIEKMTNGKAD
jgi:hypothetical protein